jgi:hypothetical protein
MILHKAVRYAQPSKSVHRNVRFGRILRLTLIAPDIIEAILSGRQPGTLQLDDLLKPLPAAWERQRSELGTSQ